MFATWRNQSSLHNFAAHLSLGTPLSAANLLPESNSSIRLQAKQRPSYCVDFSIVRNSEAKQFKA